MGPKRIAVVVLAAIAVIGVVTSVIAAAIAVLPRENRYALGTQTSNSSPIATASPAASSTGSAMAHADASNAQPPQPCSGRSRSPGRSQHDRGRQ